MTPDEAAEMLAQMRDSWPGFAPVPDAWLAQLVKARHDIALVALATVTAESVPPSVPDWQAACRSAWKALPPSRPLPAEQAASRFAEIHRVLDSTPTRYADQSKHPDLEETA